jgi:hypothetical protein
MPGEVTASGWVQTIDWPSRSVSIASDRLAQLPSHDTAGSPLLMVKLLDCRYEYSRPRGEPTRLAPSQPPHARQLLLPLVLLLPLHAQLVGLTAPGKALIEQCHDIIIGEQDGSDAFDRDAGSPVDLVAL